MIGFGFFDVCPTRESQVMKELMPQLMLARTWLSLSFPDPLGVRPFLNAL